MNTAPNSLAQNEPSHEPRKSTRPPLYPDRVKWILDGWATTDSFPSEPGEDPLRVVFSHRDFRILMDDFPTIQLFADFVVKVITDGFGDGKGYYRVERRCLPVDQVQALDLILAATIPPQLRGLLLERLKTDCAATLKVVLDSKRNLCSPMFP